MTFLYTSQLKPSTFFTCILIFICSLLIAQKPLTPTFTQIANEYFEDSSPGATLLVSKNNETIYNSSIGYRDMTSFEKIKNDDVFRIASLTKQFTAVAILKLVEEGHIGLDDSISDYIAGLNENPSSVKIKHLLSHTSGVKNYTALTDWESKTSNPDLSVKEIIDVFKNEPLNFEPGEKYSYSNLGYFMLGYIIEVASGQSFAQYLDESFFKPLKMKNTGYEDQKNPLLRPITGYSSQDGQLKEAAYLDMKLAYAAGALVSTTADLKTWNKAIFTYEVVKKESLDLAHSKFTLNDGSKVPYGFGWEIGEIKGLKTIKHDGIINGFISFGLYLPEKDVFVAVLTNCDCTPHIEEVSSMLAALAIGKPYIVEEKSATKSELLTYQGVYEADNGEKQFIAYQDGKMQSYRAGGRKDVLTYIGGHRFILENSLEEFHFKIDTEKKPTFLDKVSFDYRSSWRKVSDDLPILEEKEISSTSFEKYTGKYQIKDGFVLEVYYHDGKMYGSVMGDAKEIKAYDTDKFYTLNTDIRLEFERESDASISGVNLLLPMPMKGLKIQ